MWKLCPATRGGSSRTWAAPTWSRRTAPAWAPNKESFEWGPEGIRRMTGTPRETYAQAAGRGGAPTDVAEVLEAFKQEFKEEIKKNMLEVVKQALSAQAAASPAAAAAQGEGEASAQYLKAQLHQLQKAVAGLKEAYDKVQQKYLEGGDVHWSAFNR